jgi:uncharacterized caspase-like protein
MMVSHGRLLLGAPGALVLGLLLLLAACAKSPAPAPLAPNAAPDAAPAQRLALVIGNSAYLHAPVLGNPRNDATDMCAALRRLRFEVMCHLDVPDRAALDAHVRRYVERLTPRSEGVVFFAGHGVQVGGHNFLVPVAAGPAPRGQPATANLYGLQELFDRLRRQPPRFQLVVLDACRSELFAPTSAPTAAVPAAAPLLRALQAVPGSASGLAAVQDAPAGTMVLYATAAGGAAFDGQGRNGPLTQHVLRHIGSRGLSVEEFLKRVTADVEADTGDRYARRQSPFVYGSFSGRFCFAGCPGEREAVPMF